MGYSPEERPDFFVKRGTGKTVNGFSSANVYSWAYPQKVVFTTDDSRIFIGMAGGTPKADESNRIGTADALKLRSERDLPNSVFGGGNPPPGYSLVGGAGGPSFKSPRLVASLQTIDSDRDFFSDQLEAYNRWNAFKLPLSGKFETLISTSVDRLSDPGAAAPMDTGRPDGLDVGYLLPPSGVGYRLNTFGLSLDTTTFASRGVVATIERIGITWQKRYNEHLKGVSSAHPITRPYFVIGILSQPGNEPIRNLTQEAVKLRPGNGLEADFPYLSADSDQAHDFVTSNDATNPTDNSSQTAVGFDRPNTEALLRLLLDQPSVTKIELDPLVVDLIPDLKNDPRVIPGGRSDDLQMRRDFDQFMTVTFGSMYVDLDVDSDNSGVVDESPGEDSVEDTASNLGKFVPATTGDVDQDGVPDYADFDGGGASPRVANFTPLVIRFPDEIDLTTTRFRLIYSESNPSSLSEENELPHTGIFRVWTKDWSSVRSPASLDTGGDFVRSNQIYPVTSLTTLVGRKVVLYLEAVEPALATSQQQVVVEVLPQGVTNASNLAFTDSVNVNSGAGALLVDTNRDGVITTFAENRSDTTSAAQPFRFWINNDDDSSSDSIAWSDPDPEHYPPRRGDSEDRIINSSRDCEDLTRLWLDIGSVSELVKNPESNVYVGLKWRNIAETRPSIRLFRSSDSSGGLAHIKDATAARVQSDKFDSRRFDFCVVHADYEDLVLDPIESNSRIDQVAAGPESAIVDFVLPKSAFASLSDGKSIGHLLFEGVQEGKGELVVIVLRKKADGTWEKISEGGSVWLQLDDIRRMYVRAHSLPLPKNFPLPWQVDSPPPGPYKEDLANEKALTIPDAQLSYGAGDSIESSDQLPFVASPNEENKCVIFVHGIDMNVSEMHGYIHSFFKRLWWAGYRGRFISFRWCTPLTSDGQWGWEDNDENTSIFNSGEYRSWKGGTSLKKFVDALRNPASPFYISSNPTIGLLAHSLGNACAGEALRQGMQVNSYVALKAAVPLSCYYPVGTAAPTHPDLVTAETNSPTPQDAGSLNGYHGYLSSIGGANKINYYGAKDFWLETGTTSFKLSVDWVTNQRKYKPDNPLDMLNVYVIRYVWDSAQQKAFFRKITDTVWNRRVTDAHESMAFVARPKTSALGAVAPPPGFSGLDLDATTTYGFTEARFDHSGPFQRNIQLMYGSESGAPWSEPLYVRLMRDLQVSP